MNSHIVIIHLKDETSINYYGTHYVILKKQYDEFKYYNHIFRLNEWSMVLKIPLNVVKALHKITKEEVSREDMVNINAVDNAVSRKVLEK